MVLYLLIVSFTSALVIGGVAYLVAEYFTSSIASGKDMTQDPFHYVVNGEMIFIFIAIIIQGGIIYYLIEEKIIKEPQPIEVDDVEKAVSSLRYITIFFYILTLSIVGIATFLFLNTSSIGLKYLPMSVNTSIPSMVSLIVGMITLVVDVIITGTLLLRKDFQFNIAKMCIDLIRKNEKDEDKRTRFLGFAIDSYNKFIKRNLRLEFDTAKVFSMIISNKEKKTRIKEIVDSFDGNDKFKPVAYLAEIGGVKNTEPFLVRKKLWTNVKEVGTFLAVIIPVLVTIIQLIQLFQSFAKSSP